MGRAPVLVNTSYTAKDRNTAKDLKLMYQTPVLPLEFWLVRICPNDKFIEIFAQRFYYFEDPFYKFFALNLLFQDTGTSCSLALKHSSFLFKFFSSAFHNINFWFKISKVCPKISHFSQIFHSRGNTAKHCKEWQKILNWSTKHPKAFTSGKIHLEAILPALKNSHEYPHYMDCSMSGKIDLETILLLVAK